MSNLPQPILLVSPDGMLGRAWSELLAQRGVPFRGVSYPAFDLGDRANVERTLTAELRLVINCAAYTDVDAAETHEHP